MTEDEVVGWHHRLDGHKFDQAPGISDGQGSLACCRPWGCKELDMTERWNSTNNPLKCCPRVCAFHPQLLSSYSLLHAFLPPLDREF